MLEQLLLVLFVGFLLTLGIIIGYRSAGNFYQWKLETAEEKLRLAEHEREKAEAEWNRIEERDQEREKEIRRKIMYEQRADRLRTMHELDYVHLSIPKGVPKDYDGS